MATKIEWTSTVWNPVTGCTKISEACQNCYAEVMANRLSGIPVTKEKYRNKFEVTLHPECLDEPFSLKSPKMIFVCSMGDLFHEYVPYKFIDRVLKVIEENPQHTFQLLTKRAERMFNYFHNHRKDKAPKNCWLGVTCESNKYKARIDYLTTIEAPVRFISCEPLLGDMGDINLYGIDWVITGGESGVRARPTPAEYFYSLRDACINQNVPFFFKQWGAYGADGKKRPKYENGNLLDGKEWKEYPKEREQY